MATQEPEFWISDDKPMQLTDKQKFSFRVQRSTTDPWARDYVRLRAYIWSREMRKFMLTSDSRLHGKRIQKWKDSRSINFEPLMMPYDGIYRIRVDIVRRDWVGVETTLQTLFSKNIHVKPTGSNTHGPRYKDDEMPPEEDAVVS
ncbi:hypothetical protein F4776DRAFT_672130 [Hypoxylon sp. NC0597]|nr:hypothetical protein F4776DRAFT_672130 [Hypoxylon sp. NC0597]